MVAAAKYDVAVIGAGAAGLAAGRHLSGAGKRVVIIEARQRIGGRILTLHVADLPLPIELGAEFIHGEAHETFSIVESAALIACELPDQHIWSHKGKFQRLPGFWERIDGVRALIGGLKADVSFTEFLRTRRGLSPRMRELTRNFVEGYHAAHADRMSALALAGADTEQSEEGGNKQFRILNGYDALIEWLRAGLNPEQSEIRLGTAVRAVKWSDGAVSIDCGDDNPIRANAAIVTIPIGVWKAASEQEGAIRFDPPLDDKMKAIAKLEVGHVVKVMLRFRERFWHEENFIHSSNRFMPTWWTSAPVRSPILTGWAGGHAADALLAEGPDAIVDRALDSLAEVFGKRRRALDQLFAGSYTHDWQADPFSRGAYSYAGVGGSGAHKALARPLRRTLFFAGEATNGEQTGTVAGAIESGQRAAKEALGALAN